MPERIEDPLMSIERIRGSLSLQEKIAAVSLLLTAIAAKENGACCAPVGFEGLARTARAVGEEKACEVFDFHFKTDNFEFHSSPVSLVREYAVRLGMRVDRLIRHEDGSVTVVEIKPNGSLRDMAHGIGQALLYATALATDEPDTKVTPALFVPGKRNEIIAEACRLGGVNYLYTEESVALLNLMGEIVRWLG